MDDVVCAFAFLRVTLCGSVDTTDSHANEPCRAPADDRPRRTARATTPRDDDDEDDYADDDGRSREKDG